MNLRSFLYVATLSLALSICLRIESSFAQGYDYVFLPQKSSDVVARDLHVPGLGWLGHVGIYDATTKKMLEVLNERDVVYMKNTVKQFSEDWTNIWGARYHKEQGEQQVVIEGWWQRIFTPKYTITAKWIEGKWLPRMVRNKQGQLVQNGWIKQAAQFRCDTFVAYSYQRANRGMCNLFGGGMTPTTLMRRLPFLRPFAEVYG